MPICLSNESKVCGHTVRVRFVKLTQPIAICIAYIINSHEVRRGIIISIKRLSSGRQSKCWWFLSFAPPPIILLSSSLPPLSIICDLSTAAVLTWHRCAQSSVCAMPPAWVHTQTIISFGLANWHWDLFVGWKRSRYFVGGTEVHYT